MRTSLFLLIILLLTGSGLQAQTIKTDVAVVGQGNAAWAAGLQAAKSGVKTSIVLTADRFHLSPAKLSLPSGIALELQERMQKDIALDTAAVLKKWTDSTVGLQLIPAKGSLKMSRSGGNWIIKLSNGQSIKAKVLVNAGDQQVNDLKANKPQAFLPLDPRQPLYRTSIASGHYLRETQSNASILTLSQLLGEEDENIVQVNHLQQSMAAGQAAGAVAAYAAFFKTKTSKTNLKAVQGELLNFKQALMPLADVAVADSNWRALQVMSLMGVFDLELNQGQLKFNPEKAARFDDVKAAISAFYYKAHIWFEDHAQAQVDLDQAISLICYVGNKSPAQVKKEVEKKWKPTYKFKDQPVAGQVLTRRQLAVLLHDHLQLFDVSTDATGRIIK